jgi:hypothetical protein
LRLLLAFAALTTLAAGCGGDDASTPSRGSVACAGESVRAGLPDDFPELPGVTITKSVEAGPSTIVDGYFEGPLEDAYSQFKSAFRAAGYSVIFDEIEAQDSEVAYIGGKPQRSGFVAMRENCEESGRISVHITNRPA